MKGCGQPEMVIIHPRKKNPARLGNKPSTKIEAIRDLINPLVKLDSLLV